MKNIVKLPLEHSINSKPELVYKGKLLVPTLSGIYVIQKSEILFLKSDSNYCEIQLNNGEMICCSKTLKHIASKIPSSTFIRVHNSYIVNLTAIICIDSSYRNMLIKGEHEIPVARSQVKTLKACVQTFFDSI